MGFKFPYGNEQQLNLNWFIKKFKELLADWQHEQESIDGALDAEIQRAEDALSDVYTARDVTVAAKNDALQAKADALTAAANAAQYWQNAAASANSAATSAVTALQAAQDAADDAAQTSSDRAGVAADKAAVAADKATVASDKATVAAYKAAVEQDKDDIDDIKDAANAAALRSEGWADGTQNGTPVASGSPYYENNSKYFKEQAEDVLSSIPADYTALSNDVDELKDDVAELQQQSGGIVKTIENVAIATFDDAISTPVQKLVIDVESSQTGWTGCEVRRTGKNLLGGLPFAQSFSVAYGYSLDTDEKTFTFNRRTGSSNARLFNGLKFKPNTRYQLCVSFFTASSNSSFYVAYTDGTTESFVFNSSVKTTVWKTTAVNKTVAYFGLSWSQTGKVTCYYDESGIFEYSEPAIFEPYSGTAYLISWETEAGTITSGTLEIEANGSVTLVTGGETYQLQSITQINTLDGKNNIWADTGNINILKYLANSKNYIDTRDEAIKAIIAKELETMTADTALTANDFRIVNDTLYRITANIAAGATLTPNTNCVATTVADVLKTLL